MKPSALKGDFYTSDAIFQEELDRIFSRNWVCVGREESLPNAGDFLAQEIGNESILIVRGKDDRLRAFYNVCRHRGSMLCRESSGQFKNGIACPYHEWTYALDGKLIGAPHMSDVEGFDRANYPLFETPLEIRQGYLFVHLGESPKPFDEVFAPASETLRPWEIDRLRVARRIEYEVGANWKILVENFSDCYHCRGVHPELNALSDYRYGANDLNEGYIQGGYMFMNREGTSLSMDGGFSGPFVGGVSGEREKRIYYYLLFPNLLVVPHPDYVLSFLLWPLSPERTRVISEWLFDPAALEGGLCRPDNAVQFWDLTNKQDWDVCELAQRGVRSRAFVPGPACDEHEELVVAFDQLVLEALGRA